MYSYQTAKRRNLAKDGGRHAKLVHIFQKDRRGIMEFSHIFVSSALLWHSGEKGIGFHLQHTYPCPRISEMAGRGEMG